LIKSEDLIGAKTRRIAQLKQNFMIPKYTIEYGSNFQKHAPLNHYSTDDPVACEEFVAELLEDGYSLKGIKHEGLNLPRNEFDRVVKTAAGMLASKQVCKLLGIKPEEEKFRFGFAA
jgi:hypothetical protein